MPSTVSSSAALGGPTERLQNYRSTQAILDVANAVVTNNRKRKCKNLWTPRGQGARVQVVEVNDERAEAQFVASEVQKLLEGEAGAERPYRPDDVYDDERDTLLLDH